MAKQTKPLNVRLSDDEHQALKFLVAHSHHTPSETVRMLIRHAARTLFEQQQAAKHSPAPIAQNGEGGSL